MRTEMKAEEYLQWAGNPTTEKFLTLIKDIRTQIAEDMAGYISLGVPVDKSSSDYAAHKCETLLEIEQIDHETFNSFYGAEEKHVA